MSGWQSAVLGDYLDTVSEREFDAPFISLLWAKGFSDVHQLHGAYEFGKDFIAKRDGLQWAFQSKAGDIGLSSWRQIRAQVDEMLLDDTSHPNFDTAMPRRVVLVTTGRLVGGAAPQAQQYKAALSSKLLPVNGVSPSFEVWDREMLLEDLESAEPISLNNWDREALGQWLGLLSDIDRRQVTMRTIERASRSWSAGHRHRVTLAAAVVAHRLEQNGRRDLASRIGLALSRAGAEMIHSGDLAAGLLVADAGRDLYQQYGRSLLADVDAIAGDAEAVYLSGDEPIAGITYRVRCATVVETLGLLGLLAMESGDADEVGTVARVLKEFVLKQPGAAHPISDRWAVSLIPPAIVLYLADRSVLSEWMSRLVVWVCDHYEEGPGLASVFATEAEEIQQLIGEPYEHLDVGERRSSYLATVVLDLLAALQLDELYADAFNDFAAVGLAFPAVEPLDGPGQFHLSEESIRVEPNASFDPDAADDPTEWRRAVHHRRTPGAFQLDEVGRSWELLATALVLRDRHFLTALRHLSGLGDSKPVNPGS